MAQKQKRGSGPLPLVLLEEVPSIFFGEAVSAFALEASCSVQWLASLFSGEHNGHRTTRRVGFLPGLLGSPQQFLYEPLKEGMRQAGYMVVVPRWGRLRLHFTDFFGTVSKLADFARDEDLDYIIGHSYGGIQALALGSVLGVPVATIGSPIRGTPSKFLTGFVRLTAGLSTTRKVQAIRRKMLETVASRTLTVSGSDDRIAPPRSCRVEGATNYIGSGNHCRILVDEKAIEAIATFPDRLSA